MRWFIIVVSILLIAGYAQTELATALSKVDKEYMYEKVNLFINYDMKMERFWYYKMAGDDLLFIIISLVLTLVSYRYSFRLFLISGVFFLYHLFDAFMFWYNYRTSYAIYWGLDIAIYLCIIMLMLPVDRWRAKYKSMV